MPGQRFPEWAQGGHLVMPETIFMQWNGRLIDGVSAKDMMLAMLGRHGMNGANAPAVRFCKSGLMPLWSRQ